MAVANSINASNTDFELSSGTLQFAARDRLKTLSYVENIGIAYSGGTFTVQGANGSALSSSNPGYIILPSTVNKGRLIKYQITANQTFQDNAGTSTISGNSWGVTTQSGTAYNQDVPFYLYAVSNGAAGSPETTISFMFSRYPSAKTSPAAGSIAKSGSAVASTQGGFYSLASVTVADYASSPCLMIGSFRMRSTTNVADWTVQALSLNDGIGNFQENVKFTQVTGAFSAGASNVFSASNLPTFSGLSQVYYVNPFTAWVNVHAVATGTSVTGSTGAMSHRMPYVMDTQIGSYGQGIATNPGSSEFALLGNGNAGGGSNVLNYCIVVPSAASYSALAGGNFSSVTNTSFQISTLFQMSSA